MSHDNGGPDRTRISLGEDDSVSDGSKKPGCTPDELAAAVGAAGNEASAVESFPKSKKA